MDGARDGKKSGRSPTFFLFPLLSHLATYCVFASTALHCTALHHCTALLCNMDCSEDLFNAVYCRLEQCIVATSTMSLMAQLLTVRSYQSSWINFNFNFNFNYLQYLIYNFDIQNFLNTWLGRPKKWPWMLSFEIRCRPWSVDKHGGAETADSTSYCWATLQTPPIDYRLSRIKVTQSYTNMDNK